PYRVRADAPGRGSPAGAVHLPIPPARRPSAGPDPNLPRHPGARRADRTRRDGRLSADHRTALERRPRRLPSHSHGVPHRPTTALASGSAWDATIPSLIASTFGGFVEPMIQRGTRAIDQALGQESLPDLFRPAGSQLDAPSLASLARLGFRTVIVDPDYLGQ